MARWEPPETGLEIVEGLAGSGKSYEVVNRIIKVVLNSKRPIFTNLPLRFRTIRKYLALRGRDPMLARYVLPLSPDHLDRFLNRNNDLANKIEKGKVEGWSAKVVEAEFLRQNGPHIYVGHHANWFPPFSVFCIDEVHRWFDQRFQKGENPNLQNWLTMHRHHLHWIWCLTQNRMQVSLPWRRNAHVYIKCVDMRRIPLFGLRIPFPIFHYEEWPADTEDAANPNAKPSKSWNTYPLLDDGLIWRLYDSFTHMGGPRKLARALAEVRRMIESGALERGQSESAN